MQMQKKKPPVKKDRDFYKPKDKQKALQAEHSKAMSSAQQLGLVLDQPQVNMICFCGSIGCRIGEFVPDNEVGKR